VEYNMNNDIINRRLEAAKQQITDMQRKVNQPTPVQKESTNLVPAGVPQAAVDTPDTQTSIPGVITGGPKQSNKMKEV